MTRRDKAIIKEHKPYLVIDESKWTTEIDENGRKIVTGYGQNLLTNARYCGRAVCEIQDLEYYSYFLGTRIAFIKINIACLKDIIDYCKCLDIFKDDIIHFKKELRIYYAELDMLRRTSRKQQYEKFHYLRNKHTGVKI